MDMTTQCSPDLPTDKPQQDGNDSLLSTLPLFRWIRVRRKRFLSSHPTSLQINRRRVPSYLVFVNRRYSMTRGLVVAELSVQIPPLILPRETFQAQEWGQVRMGNEQCESLRSEMGIVGNLSLYARQLHHISTMIYIN